MNDCKDCLVADRLRESLLELKRDVEKSENKIDELEKVLNSYITKTEKQQIVINSFQKNFDKIEKIGYGIIATILLSYAKDFLHILK